MASPEQHTIQSFVSNIRAVMTVLLIAMVFLTFGIGHPAQAQTFTVLHSFAGGLDGTNPLAGLAIDRSGNLYGTTVRGGAGQNGVVFKLAYKGSSWILTPLYSFAAGSDGASPYAAVIFGPNGTLYGTTADGGARGDCGADGCGTVFNLTPSATVCKTALCPWTETVLYRFDGGSDGGVPSSPVIFDQAGNIYGTTYVGGSSNSGTVFKLAPSNGDWTESVLHNFGGGNDGTYPTAGVVLDHAGNIFGATYEGGSGVYGTLFELTPSGSGWTENILYNFQGQGPVGCCPAAGLIFDSAGNLYGAASAGGRNVGGSIFELTPAGEGWTFNLVYSLPGGGTGPEQPLVMDSSGNLYGTANQSGGAYGSVFKLTQSNGNWIYTRLHDFTGGTDGGNPLSSLVIDANGNLYGTTVYGGSLTCGDEGMGCGVVFEISP